MNLSLHPMRFPATLEKWYIDTLLDDGAVLLIYLGMLSVSYLRAARVTAELFLSDGSGPHGSVNANHLSGGENILHFGSATIAGDRLSFVTPGLSGELTYHPRYPPFALREPFLAEGNRSLHWLVEIPDADVTGTLRWPGGERAIAGRGYRDRVWFDFPPWRFPIHELIWGRAAAGNHAATWVRAITDQGIIAAAWLDGQLAPIADDSGLPAEVTLGASRIFLDTDVVSMEGLRLGVLRGVLRHFSGDPHQTKWQAPCVIAGERGVAVHEVVRWRKHN